MGPNLWVYKCNVNWHGLQKSTGDWNKLFAQRKAVQWGGTKSTGDKRSLQIINGHIAKGDTILAYQTNERALLGICTVSKIKDEGEERWLWLRPLRKLARPILIHQLKAQHPILRNVEAFKPGWPRTLYTFSATDRRALESACGIDLTTGEPRSTADDGVYAQDAVEDTYLPTGSDDRQRVRRQIRERRGQQTFRNELRDLYGDRCWISGCSLLDVLEAAHISPYRGKRDQHRDNGLLLRADLHTLFDLDLLGIDPRTLMVRLHPGVIEPEYRQLDGRRFDVITSGRIPSCWPLGGVRFVVGGGSQSERAIRTTRPVRT